MARYDLGKYKITPKGEYNANTEYGELDLVTYQGSSFLALTNIIGNTPSENNENWQLIAKGITDEYIRETVKKALDEILEGEI